MYVLYVCMFSFKKIHNTLLTGAMKALSTGQMQNSSLTRSAPASAPTAATPLRKCLPPAEAVINIDMKKPPAEGKVKSTWIAQQAILKYSAVPVSTPIQPALVANCFVSENKKLCGDDIFSFVLQCHCKTTCRKRGRLSKTPPLLSS